MLFSSYYKIFDLLHVFADLSLFPRIINSFENVIKMSAVSIFRSRSTLCWQKIKILHVATLTSFTAIILPKPTAI